MKFILPALLEAKGAYRDSIKYALFPPLGLATLAGFLAPDDRAVIEDEHVQTLDLDDQPDIVAIQVYVTSAMRSYQIADHYRQKGAYVVMGGLHPTARPMEAVRFADTIFMGPADVSWPQFLADFRKGVPKPVYRSGNRTLAGLPPARRDLFQPGRYLVPNSLVVSRGCPHTCDFCYKETFYKGGRSFYTQSIDRTLDEIDRLPGRHLFFLDDHLFGDRKFALELFGAMKGMNRVWQAAGTIRSVLDSELLSAASACGLRSLFIGFESLSSENLRACSKHQNVGADYNRAVDLLHQSGVMINGSFIFGMDRDDDSVFHHTVDWALNKSIETATFHILTPYPGTRLYARMRRQGRLLTTNWNRYDTRHAVFRPARMSAARLEEGYWSAYRRFYSWSSVFKSAAGQSSFKAALRHLAYTVGWKKMAGFWSFLIRRHAVQGMVPVLERLLNVRERKNADAALDEPLQIIAENDPIG